ncbi:hypothetical protein OFM36_33950, partial [Escherichia coli]|nr:hypothetical protein [Escherichia coli]
RRELLSANGLIDLLEKELLVPEADFEQPVRTTREVIGHFPKIKAGATHPHIPNHRARSLSELNQQRIGSAKPGESNAYMASTPHGDLS